MTAIPLFDLIASTAADSTVSAGDRDTNHRLTQLAENMIADAIRQFRQVRELDEACGPSVHARSQELRREIAVLLRLMYEECADHADKILSRASRLERPGQPLSGAEELRDLVGQARAMLSVTLADIDEGREQIRQGKAHTAEEVRNELRRSVQR